MAEPKSVIIRLTDPEIAVIYESFTEDTSRVPYGDLLGDYPEESWPVATHVARLTLEARGLLAIDEDGKAVVDVSLAAIMAGMLLAEQSVTVTTRNSGEPPRKVAFRHYEDQIFLSHEIAPGGVHHFVLLPDRAMFIETIREAMEVQAPKKAPSLGLEEVPAGLIEAVIDQVNGGPASVLNGTNLPEDGVQSLTDALSGTRQLKSLSIFDKTDGDRHITQGLTFLQGETTVLQVAEDGTQPDVVRVTSMDASGVENLMEPVLAAL